MIGRVHRLQRRGGTLGQLLAIAVGLVLTLIAFTMLAAFAVAALGFALVGLVRMWWLGRRRRSRQPGVLTVEYTVEDPRGESADPGLPPASRHR